MTKKLIGLMVSAGFVLGGCFVHSNDRIGPNGHARAGCPRGMHWSPGHSKCVKDWQRKKGKMVYTK
jgi:hypothetical protein